MLNKQTLTNEIAKKLHSSAPANYEIAELVYKIILDDNERITSFYASFIINGKKTPPKGFSILQDELEPLLDQLHNLVKTQEGKDWRKLTLTIQDRKVNIEFNYTEQNL